MLVLLAVCGVGYWLYSALHTPVTHTSTEEYITIEEGSSANYIIEVLGSYGVIQEPLATRIYLRFIEPDTRLEAGDYQFSSPISPLQAIEKLKNGRRRTQALTIPEGRQVYK